MFAWSLVSLLGLVLDLVSCVFGFVRTDGWASLEIVVFTPRIIDQRFLQPREKNAGVDKVNDLKVLFPRFYFSIKLFSIKSLHFWVVVECCGITLLVFSVNTKKY